jgi:uncharacterized protein YbaR (Trm112 family)
MAGRSESDVLVCCFCADLVERAHATLLVVYPPGDPEESQALYCHGRHLVQSLHDSIPHLPALDDD